jgi:hypothetical protein
MHCSKQYPCPPHACHWCGHNCWFERRWLACIINTPLSSPCHLVQLQPWATIPDYTIVSIPKIIDFESKSDMFEGMTDRLTMVKCEMRVTLHIRWSIVAVKCVMHAVHFGREACYLMNPHMHRPKLHTCPSLGHHRYGNNNSTFTPVSKGLHWLWWLNAECVSCSMRHFIDPLWRLNAWCM